MIFIGTVDRGIWMIPVAVLTVVLLNCVPYSIFGMERNVNLSAVQMIEPASIQIVQHTPTLHITMSAVQPAKIIPLKNLIAIAQMIRIIRIQFATNDAHQTVCFESCEQPVYES